MGKESVSSLRTPTIFIRKTEISFAKNIERNQRIDSTSRICVIVVSENDEYGDKVVDGDQLMEDALEAGAADFAADGDVFEVTTEPDDFSAVRDALEAKGYTFVSAELEMVPDVYTAITDPELVVKMEKLLDVLEDNDDVQNVWHNWDRPEEE